jgi:hypothetical protein
MNPKVRNLILTESQEACLDALRSRKGFKTDIAIRAKLDLKKVEKALEALKELGLAKRDEMNSWHFTSAEEIVGPRLFRIEFCVVGHFLVPAPGVCSIFWTSRCGAINSPKGWASLLKEFVSLWSNFMRKDL